MTTNDRTEYIETATRHAAICLLWQASDSSDAGNGYPIGEDGDEYVDDVIPLISEAVSAFVADTWEVLNTARVTAAQCGHDLVLTANHHGTGFWDRGLGDAGAKLTEATRGYSFDAEFELWGGRADGDEHCSDELCWLMVENVVLVDLIGASA